jgi:integrase
MPSFRSAQAQARQAAARLAAHGVARHTDRNSGRIHSLGTERSYRQTFAQAAEWLKANGYLEGLHCMRPELAQAYLQERAGQVAQSTLDRDRQALQALVGEKLERVRSAVDRAGLAEQGRAYTPAQVRLVAEAQAPPNALATEIAYAAGLRAHELYTLRPAEERAAAGHRDWALERFSGREDLARYTVVGKGGLVREVALPRALAARLEAVRLGAPRPVSDRGIRYAQHYALGAGQAWSQSFTAASTRALGWSTGAHGLRHSYAQARLSELQGRGYTYHAALGLVSQEMGHFRPDITAVYLR